MVKKKSTASSNKLMGAPECDMDWRSKSDCMTLQQAEEIKRDSKRHGAAKKHAAKEAKTLAAIAGK